MMVIAKNTESQLLQELQKIKKSTNGSKRCFHLAFSQSDMPSQTVFEHFIKLLQEVPNAYLAQVYLCEDNDIFILMEGFMQRQFMEFLLKLSEAMNTEEIIGLAKIFEINREWAALEEICSAKIILIEKQNQERADALRDENHQKMLRDMMAGLDKDKIASLKARRLEHSVPVILIVDDDQLSRTLAGNVLREDYNPHFARNGQEALKEFVASAPEVVFLDIGMPDISGHEVLDCIFQIDPGAYVIMFSGRKDKANMLRAFKSGAQGFLGKPFTREKLYQHVSKSHLIPQQKTPPEKRQA